MMQVSKDFYIKCNKCGSLVQIDTNSLEYETTTYERPMGEEIEYNFYGEICCERCHTWISFNIRGNEYPVGAYNYSDFNCCGGVFVDKPWNTVNRVDTIFNRFLEGTRCYSY